MQSQMIKELAEQMGVSVSDVECFARSIANSIQKDRAAEAFVSNFDDDMRCEMVQAYAAHAVRKINEFHTSYITNPDVNHLFNDMVYAGIVHGEIK